MELTVEKKGPCEALIQFTVSPEEFGRRVQQGLAAAAQQVRVKGFRPGKVPGKLLEKSHGEAVRREARAQFVQEAYRRAIAEHELRPAAHPRIDVDGLEHEADRPLSVSMQVFLRPVVELQQYKGIEVEGRPLDVKEEEVDAAIADVRNQRATPEPAGEQGLSADGVAQCKVVFLHGDEEVFSRETLQVRPDSPLAGIDADAFREALVGAVDGDVRELPFTFPADFHREDLRGQDGLLRVEIRSTFRIVPASDEELRKLLGVEDDEGLRAKVKEEIGRAKREQEERRIEAALLEELLLSHPMELPESLVQDQAETRTSEMRRQLAEQGVPEEEIAQQVAGQGEAGRESAARSLRAYFLIDEIAKAEGIAVQEEDVLDELHRIAARNNASFDEVRDYYRDENLFGQLGMELLEKKVRVFLRENAKVTETAPSA